jgi:hypothetical protein
MIKDFSTSRFISVFLLFLFGFIMLSGFHINNQVVPPLDEIVPVTRNINSTKEIFVPARGSWNWIDLRLTNMPIQFAINGGNMIDSLSDTYQIIRRSLQVGNEITVWAIPKGPNINEAFFFTDINRTPLHELDLTAPDETADNMGNFQEIKKVNYKNKVLAYDVVQIVLNGQVLLSYDIYAKAKNKTDKILYFTWIVFGIITLITGIYLFPKLFTKTATKEN